MVIRPVRVGSGLGEYVVDEDCSHYWESNLRVCAESPRKLDLSIRM